MQKAIRVVQHKRKKRRHYKSPFTELGKFDLLVSVLIEFNKNIIHLRKGVTQSPIKGRETFLPCREPLQPRSGASCSNLADLRLCYLPLQCPMRASTLLSARETCQRG